MGRDLNAGQGDRTGKVGGHKGGSGQWSPDPEDKVRDDVNETEGDEDLLKVAFVKQPQKPTLDQQADHPAACRACENPEQETPGPNELYQVGTIATVHRLLRAPDGTVRLLVQGMERFRLGEFVEEEPYLKAHIHLIPETAETNLETSALARNAREQFQLITQMIPSFPDELVGSITSLEDPLQTAYTIANFQRMDLKDAQEILELDSVYDKLKKLIGLLVREAEVLQI